jgi:hypothetical protein
VKGDVEQSAGECDEPRIRERQYQRLGVHETGSFPEINLPQHLEVAFPRSHT